MFAQGLMIAALGMGGVFFFLFILICFMHLLPMFHSHDADRAKIAAAIAVALHNNQKS